MFVSLKLFEILLNIFLFSEAIMSPPQIKPLDVVGQLGDLSKIDISAEVTRLLTTMSQSQNQFAFPLKTADDATMPQSTASTSSLSDPRTARQVSVRWKN